jgi:1-acyl-sn-glycerol-3-phosphate acyltransferase
MGIDAAAIRLSGRDPSSYAADGLGTRVLRSGLQHGLIFPALRAVCRLEVEAPSALAQLPGGFVVVANHTSHLDCPVLLRALSSDVRSRTRVAAAADYFYRSRLRGAVVTAAFGAVPIERRGNAAASLAVLHDVLVAGGVVVIFPEGTRARDGQIARFRCGAARLAVSAGVPVVPAAIVGMHDVLPVGARRPHRGQVAVRFGNPMRTTAGECANALTVRVERAVRDLAEGRR